MQVVGPRFANSRKLTAQQPQNAPCFAVDAMGNSPGGFERHRVHLLQGIKKYCDRLSKILQNSDKVRDHP